MALDVGRVSHRQSAGFTLIEVMVALALIGLITIAFVERSSAYSHAARVTQVVRDIDALSETGWQMRRVLTGSTNAQLGGRVIDAAFVHDRHSKTATNSYTDALGGKLRVDVSNAVGYSLLYILVYSLSVGDCTALLEQLDVQDFYMVYKGAYMLKNNGVSPYGGELSGGVAATQNACSSLSTGQPLQLRRRLDL